MKLRLNVQYNKYSNLKILSEYFIKVLTFARLIHELFYLYKNEDFDQELMSRSFLPDRMDAILFAIVIIQNTFMIGLI